MDERQSVSIVVADDLELMREGIASLCESWGFRVAARCPDGTSALRAMQALQPEAAILDLSLPGLDTFEVIRRVRDAGLPVRVLVLSLRDDRKTVMEALRAGAQGYVLKSGPARHLREGILQILDGAVFVSPDLGPDRLFAPRNESSAGDPLETLSAREHQVLRLLVEGLRAKEIAGRLELSAKTIDTYRASLMRKLDIHDLAGLVKFAIQRNLTTLE